MSISIILNSDNIQEVLQIKIYIFFLLILITHYLTDKALANNQNTSLKVNDISNLKNLKTSFRLANGSYFQTNSLITGGNTTTTLSPDINTLYFFTPKHALGIGLDIHFSMAIGNVMLFGQNLVYRWYMKGNGYPKISNQAFDSKSSSLSPYAIYLASTLRRYSYFLGNQLEDEDQESPYEAKGSFWSIDVSAGYDKRINESFEFNVEINTTILSLAFTDSRIRMGNLLLYLGIAHWY